MLFNELSLKCKNFGCFADEPQGFDQIKQVNVIIGRNNAGKTTLLDLVEKSTDAKRQIGRAHKNKRPEFIFTIRLSEADLRTHLSQDVTTISYAGGKTSLNPRAWANDYLLRSSATISIAKPEDAEPYCAGLGSHPFDESMVGAQAKTVAHTLAKRLKNPLAGRPFRRIAAERHILPEGMSRGMSIEPNGDGITAVIANFLLNAKYDNTVVEQEFLAELNKVFSPDSKFTRIFPRLQDNNHWELFIQEDGKELVAFSNMGSGLKTVVQVLANLLLVPLLDPQFPDIGQYVFGFEELENNLHPAIQRRLLKYLRDRAVDSKYLLFVTTHSNVVIDLFADDDIAQIVHVTHDGSTSTARSVVSKAHGRKILDDLDVRASDLLQTNVVIWVEGPSDRIFVNRWIHLWSLGNLIEGIHYQCLPFGGSVGSHFSFDEPADVEDLIACLHVNRHAILLIDRDRANDSDTLKAGAQRMLDDVVRTGGYGWVTAGREVENYVPCSTLRKVLNDDSATDPGAFVHLIDHVAEKKGRAGIKKVEFAVATAPLLERDDLVSHLDLAKRLDDICDRIKLWNRIETP